MNLKLIKAVGALALGLALIGCGGSGTNNDNENFNRVIQLGDSWVLEGTIVNDVETRNVSVDVDVVNRTLNGQTYLTLLRNRTVDGTTRIAGDLVTQGPNNHDLTIVGTVREAEEPVDVPDELFLPGRLIVGLQWTVVNTADPNDDQTFEVVAEERITTPAGTFDTFKIHGTTVDGTTSDRWLSTHLGYFVKTVNTRATEDGTEVETKLLTSTTVP